MKKTILVLLLSIFIVVPTKSQDILASISVASRSVEGTDRSVYDAMQKTLNDIVNSRTWTPYQLKSDERFRLRISINITERRSDNEFDGEITVAMNRLVYNSSYESPVFSLIDRKMHFYYNQFEPIEFIESSFTNNLVSVVAFYIYFSLGLQFDTFQSSGGQEFYSKASNVVQTAQTSRETGWASQDGDRSRYWLVENILSPTYSGLRTFLYQYHRQGLDIMAENLENGRTYVLRAIEVLKRVYDERPGMYITQIIIDAKRDEIINIFSGASDSEKKSVVNIMKQIDASNASRYDVINTTSTGNMQNNSTFPSGGSTFPSGSDRQQQTLPSGKR
jgi:hypothetical protein